MPEWMLKLKAPDKKRRKELEKHPLRRKCISTEISAHIDKGFQKKLKNTQRQNEKLIKKAKESKEEDGRDEFQFDDKEDEEDLIE